MIYGTGIDLAFIPRFEKWVKDKNLTRRFFNTEEIFLPDTLENACETKSISDFTPRQISAMCRHYASRFAAKEAFSKALGTGISGFDLREVYVKKNQNGKPFLIVEGKAKEILEHECGASCIHLSLTHEKDYAAAIVIIEKL